MKTTATLCCVVGGIVLHVKSTYGLPVKPSGEGQHFHRSSSPSKSHSSDVKMHEVGTPSTSTYGKGALSQHVSTNPQTHTSRENDLLQALRESKAAHREGKSKAHVSSLYSITSRSQKDTDVLLNRRPRSVILSSNESKKRLEGAHWQKRRGKDRGRHR